MTFDKCLALAFSLMILGQAYLVRRYVGTWLFPACIFGLFWFGYTFFPLAILFWVPVNPYAIAFIFLCTVAFSMGSLAFDWKTAFARNTWKRETTAVVYGSRFLRNVFYATTLSSLLFLVLNLVVQGFSLRELFIDLYASASAYADLVYSESVKINIFDRFGVVFAYSGAILGGLIFSYSTKKARRFILVLSFLPAIFTAVVQSSKGTLFLSVVFFYAGILVYRLSAGNLYLFEKGNIKALTFCALVLVLITTVSFMSRGLDSIEDSEEVRGMLLARFASYSSGHIYGFSDWFAFFIGKPSAIVYPHEGTAYGFYTLTPIFKMLGSHKVTPLGIFDDYYSYGDLLAGNIYTMFRGLILDFGIVGSVLFMFSIGFLLHSAFYSMLCKRRPVFGVALFIFAVAYFYNSFIVSLLVWSNIYVAFALLWTILQANRLVTQTDGHRLTMVTEVPALS